jgi:hypothetical protein
MLTVIFEPMIYPRVKSVDKPIYRSEMTMIMKPVRTLRVKAAEGREKVESIPTPRGDVVVSKFQRVIFDNPEMIDDIANELGIKGSQNQRILEVTKGLKFRPSEDENRFRLTVESYSPDDAYEKVNIISKYFLAANQEVPGIRVVRDEVAVVDTFEVEKSEIGYYYYISIFSYGISFGVAMLVIALGLIVYLFVKEKKNGLSAHATC